jgi:beta-glucosidase
MGPASVWAQEAGAPPVNLAAAEARADQTVKAMTADERTTLTHGIMAIQLFPARRRSPRMPCRARGYIAGLPRLGVPALKETDASLGVAWVGGARKRGRRRCLRAWPRRQAGIRPCCTMAAR